MTKRQMLGSILTEYVSLVIDILQILVFFFPKHPLIYIYTDYGGLCGYIKLN